MGRQLADTERETIVLLHWLFHLKRKELQTMMSSLLNETKSGKDAQITYEHVIDVEEKYELQKREDLYSKVKSMFQLKDCDNPWLVRYVTLQRKDTSVSAEAINDKCMITIYSAVELKTGRLFVRAYKNEQFRNSNLYRFLIDFLGGYVQDIKVTNIITTEDYRDEKYCPKRNKNNFDDYIILTYDNARKEPIVGFESKQHVLEIDESIKNLLLKHKCNDYDLQSNEVNELLFQYGHMSILETLKNIKKIDINNKFVGHISRKLQ